MRILPISFAFSSATVAAVGDQVAGVLSKPFDLEALLAVLNRVSPPRTGS